MLDNYTACDIMLIVQYNTSASFPNNALHKGEQMHALISTLVSTIVSGLKDLQTRVEASAPLEAFGLRLPIWKEYLESAQKGRDKFTTWTAGRLESEICQLEKLSSSFNLVAQMVGRIKTLHLELEAALPLEAYGLNLDEWKEFLSGMMGLEEEFINWSDRRTRYELSLVQKRGKELDRMQRAFFVSTFLRLRIEAEIDRIGDIGEEQILLLRRRDIQERMSARPTSEIREALLALMGKIDECRQRADARRRVVPTKPPVYCGASRKAEKRFKDQARREEMKGTISGGKKGLARQSA